MPPKTKPIFYYWKKRSKKATRQKDHLKFKAVFKKNLYFSFSIVSHGFKSDHLDLIKHKNDVFTSICTKQFKVYG